MARLIMKQLRPEVEEVFRDVGGGGGMRGSETERRFMTEMMTSLSTNGEAPLPRRAPRGLLPSTWLQRELRVEYADAHGKAAQTSGGLSRRWT